MRPRQIEDLALEELLPVFHTGFSPASKLAIENRTSSPVLPHLCISVYRGFTVSAQPSGFCAERMSFLLLTFSFLKEK